MLNQRYGLHFYPPCLYLPFSADHEEEEAHWVTSEPRTKWAQIIWQVFLSVHRSWLLLTDDATGSIQFFCKVAQMDYYWQREHSNHNLISALNNYLNHNLFLLNLSSKLNGMSTLRVILVQLLCPQHAAMFSLPHSLAYSPTSLLFLLRLPLYQALPSGFFQV